MNFISILEVDEVAEGLLASAGAEIQVQGQTCRERPFFI